MINLKKIMAMLLSLLIFSSCNSQEKKNSNETTNREVKKMKIEFNFYPSSGGNAIYTIVCSDDILYIKNLEPVGNETSDYKKKLTEKEIKRVKQVVYEVIKREDVETEIILDTWRVELIIDGDIYYNKSDVNLKTLPIDIKNLLDLLIEDSTVKIDLYGFS
jgi:hypothetical protein